MAGFVNTNLANFSKGNVGSRLGATEWTGHHMRIFRTFRNGERNTPEDAYICPISAFSAAGQIMPRVPNEPSGNARKSLAGYGEKFPTKLWNGDGADTPVETTCSLIGLPSDTVFFKGVTQYPPS